jgi:exodeoxyribonuclease VII large subunit
VKDLFDLPFDGEPAPEIGPAEPGEPAEANERAEAPERHVYTVAELTSEIRALLDAHFPRVFVEGEISNCRVWSGHLYFTLRDPDAQLKAIMFRSALRRLRFKPEDGLHVLARGAVSVYDPKGEYQLVCEHLEPHGLGAFQFAYDQLRKRLQTEGLFDQARKRPLPALPRKIGVVTSLDGAAIRDIVKVLDRRYPNVHLVIRPARVQGEGAAAEIARGLSEVARVAGVEVVIVGRGGGSIEDLWAFNEEVVARAIAASPVPVISAVGHETDVTIADFVADVRAPTPSAAAEIVVARKDEVAAGIDRLAFRLRAAARGRVDRLRTLVHRLAGRPGLAGWPGRLALRGRDAAELAHELRRVARDLVARRQRPLRDLRERLEGFDLRRRLGGIATKLVAADAALERAVVRARHRGDTRLRDLAGRLESLSPLAVLARGYAVCWNRERTAILRDAAAVRAGDRVRVTLSRGELGCRVEESSHGTDRQGL